MMSEQLAAGIGGALILVAQVWVALVAFRKGLLWGLLVLCLPPVAFVFIVLNWRHTRRAVILYVVGALLAGWGGARLREQQLIEESRGTIHEA